MANKMPATGHLGKKFRQIVAETNERGEELMYEGSRMGVEMMRERIGNDSGGKGAWTRDWGEYYDYPESHAVKGRTGSVGGRVATGNMRDSVTSWTSKGTGSKDGKTRMAFGWPRNVEPYFLMQEYGFNHRDAGHRVQGMFALQNTYEDVRVWLSYKFAHLAKGKRR